MGQHQHQHNNRWGNVNLVSTPTYPSSHSCHATWVKSSQSFESLEELKNKHPVFLWEADFVVGCQWAFHVMSELFHINFIENLDIFSKKHRWVVKHGVLLFRDLDNSAFELQTYVYFYFYCNQHMWAPLTSAKKDPFRTQNFVWSGSCKRKVTQNEIFVAFSNMHKPPLLPCWQLSRSTPPGYSSESGIKAWLGSKTRHGSCMELHYLLSRQIYTKSWWPF